MKLTTADKKYLLSIGEDERYFGDIAAAADVTTYELCDEDGKQKIRDISRKEAMELLGREGWLNGLDRSAFHYTAMRETIDGKNYILFDSSKLFK